MKCLTRFPKAGRGHVASLRMLQSPRGRVNVGGRWDESSGTRAPSAHVDIGVGPNEWFIYLLFIVIGLLTLFPN